MTLQITVNDNLDHFRLKRLYSQDTVKSRHEKIKTFLDSKENEDLFHRKIKIIKKHFKQ